MSTSSPWAGSPSRTLALGQRPNHKGNGVGWETVHVAVDDAIRLASVEVLPDQRRVTVVGLVPRALA